MKFCVKCGTQLDDEDNFCAKCGYASSPQPQEEKADLTNGENEPCNSEQPNAVHTETPNIFETIVDKTANINRKLVITTIAIVLCVAVIITICLKVMPYKCFDFKDGKLIEVLNELGAYTSQSPIDIDTDAFASDVTVYRVSCLDETGLLVLSHGFSGHIRCIMVVFEDSKSTSAALISAIASELDYSFSPNKAMNSLLLDDEVYSSDKYATISKKLSSDLTGFFLAPSKHLQYCVNSVLPD